MTIDFGEVVHMSGTAQAPEVLVVCEHASNRIPDGFDHLGLDAPARASHVAWDPGALGVAQRVTEKLSGLLVSANISRLIYDCNRPPSAATAIPATSEVYAVPGNQGLSVSDRQARIANVYDPFCTALTQAAAQHQKTLQALVTIHSFTPIYHGNTRSVEVGVLHGQDDRLALAMMGCQPASAAFQVALNEPYSAADGVTHTLDLHGAANGLANVMIEIRNDLITTPEAQVAMADDLGDWIAVALQKGAQT